MQTVGMRPVVVHGGGKAITHAMEKAGLEPRWVQGRRYTDDATLAIVARVLAEEINEDIVRHIRKFGGRASGLHHKTHQCLFGSRLTLPDAEGNPIDLGRVGEVTEVNAEPIIDLCLAGVVPVLPSLAEDDEGDDGLLQRQRRHRRRGRGHGPEGREARLPDRHPRHPRRPPRPGQPHAQPDPADCRDLIARGVIDKGMIPKVEACLASLDAGVKKVHIVNGRMRHSLLVEMYTTTGVGPRSHSEVRRLNGQRAAASTDRVPVHVQARPAG